MITTLFFEQMPQLRFYLLFTGYVSLVLTAFFSPLSVTGTNICITAAAICSVLSGQFSLRFKTVITNPLVPIILLFMCLVLLGMFWSIGPWSERISSLHKYAKLLYIPFLIPLCLDRVWRNMAITAFLVAMTLTVLLSFLKAYAGLNLGDASTGWVFHSHIETGYFVAFATYLLVTRALKPEKQRWIYWFLAVLFTYQEFLINDGRTGWLTFVLLTFLFFVHQFQSNQKNQRSFRRSISVWFRVGFYSIGILLFLCTLSYYLSPQFNANIAYWVKGPEKTRTFDPASQNFRLDFLNLSLSFIKQHPIIGFGTGSFPETYRQSRGIPAWGTRLNNPHNEYLLVTTQFGFIGLFILLYFFYTQWRMSAGLGENRKVAQALIASFMLASLFNSFLYTSVMGHFYVLFTSLLFADYTHST